MSVSPGADLMPVEAAAVCPEHGPVRELVVGEVLFQPRDPRTQLYIIERGMIALSRDQLGEHQEVIEFAFIGDVVGLGFLDQHIYWAKALSRSRFRSLPLSALDGLLQKNERTRYRYADAVQREFLVRREERIDAFCGIQRSELHPSSRPFPASMGRRAER
jgi:CRP-like cAMP-binding protein